MIVCSDGEGFTPIPDLVPTSRVFRMKNDNILKSTIHIHSFLLHSILIDALYHFCEDDTSSAEMLFSLRNKSAMRQCYLNPRWKYDKREKQSFKICKPDMMSDEPSMHRDTF